MNIVRAARAAFVLSTITAAAIAAPATADVLDGSFEIQGAASPSGCTGTCATGAWDVQGRAGFNTKNDWNSTTPAGQYKSFIQSFGAVTGSLSQTLQLTQGVYDLSFLSAGRGQSGFYTDNGQSISYNGVVTYDVLFDGVSLYSETTRTLSGFAQRSVNSINVATTGLHTLTFATRALGPNRDGIAHIDNVSITAAVPEPATWAMMMLGFGAMGFAMRRKKVNTRIRFA